MCVAVCVCVVVWMWKGGQGDVGTKQKGSAGRRSWEGGRGIKRMLVSTLDGGRGQRCDDFLSR